jgi:hypothetical protein
MFVSETGSAKVGTARRNMPVNTHKINLIVMMHPFK